MILNSQSSAMASLLFILLLSCNVPRTAAGAVSYNGLATTPQMGWDNWNSFGCQISAALLESAARRIVNLGLRDVGYEYVVLDDCWSAGRDKDGDGSLIVNAERFPDGMAAVVNKIHSLGLKFGIYSDAGRWTCGSYEGSLGYEELDAQTFANWGCYNEGQAGTQKLSRDRYATMSSALKATGRPILYSLCNWGEDYPWNWGSTIANSWRMSGDIFDSFDQPDSRCPCDGDNAADCAVPGFHCSTLNILNKASFIVSKAQTGGWNDLDMLTVGLGGQTDAEYVTHFSMWAALKSPLLMGNDLRKLNNKTYSILTNAAVIAVNQDPLYSSAARHWVRETGDINQWHRPCTIQMWVGSLESTTNTEWPDAVVIFINGQNSPLSMDATLDDIFSDFGSGGTAPQATLVWEVRDLWGYRMTEEEAQAILDAANATESGTGSGLASVDTSKLYNATAKSYKQGLAARDELLLGKFIGTVEPHGTITANVDTHGAVMFRLRAQTTKDARRVEL